MKHKHCDLIKAWADGAIVQFRFRKNEEWSDISYPTWKENIEYRIKPKTIKYRLYLDCGGQIQIATGLLSAHQDSYFSKWLGDWQEVVVE